jgi:hypothetical protein
MGREQLQALARIIEEQLAQGVDNAVVGSWTIRYDGAKQVIYFEKCEDGFYCEERPAVIGLDGTVIDKGGPILIEEV